MKIINKNIIFKFFLASSLCVAGCSDEGEAKNSDIAAESSRDIAPGFVESETVPQPDENCAQHVITSGFGNTDGDPEYPTYRMFCPVSSAVKLHQIRHSSPVYFDMEMDIANYTGCRSMKVLSRKMTVGVYCYNKETAEIMSFNKRTGSWRVCKSDEPICDTDH